MNLANGLWAWSVVTLACAFSCTSGERRESIGDDCGGAFCPQTAPPLESADAAADSTTVQMCPVTTCVAPWATCPTSQVPCDVDLAHDRDNCGSCGATCGDSDNWSCVGGKCTLGCAQPYTADCDGDASNECEVDIGRDPNNCGDCGNKCSAGFICDGAGCVDRCARSGPDSCDGVCTDLSNDDANCGRCGTQCDRAGAGAPTLPSDMYYGCARATCGAMKCADFNKVDCNSNPSDGCETALHTNDDCSKCGDACAPGKQCMYTNGRWLCLCQDDAETLCGLSCKQLLDDPENCGGCGRVCPGLQLAHFEATCAQGACGGHCSSGYADCDGLTDNGCEVNQRVDNRHCGGCGNACLPDQVCFDGTCLVAPCDPTGATR